MKSDNHKRKKRTATRTQTVAQPSEPLAALPARESKEIILAIRKGKIDALVTGGSAGERVLTLQGAHEPYRVLVETINDGVATVDENGVILFANSRLAAILRVSAETIVGLQLQNLVSATDRRLLQKLIAEGLRNSAQGEISVDAAEGRPRLVRMALNPMRDSEPPTVCVVATELTELAEANEALRAREDALRQLSARLLKLQDEERRRIARDLHDITGQKLAVQAMALSEVLECKNQTLDAESRRALSDCAGLSRQIGDEIRILSYLLHPPLLDELGLCSAVKWYAEGFEKRTGVQLDVTIASDFPRLSPDAEVALFRVVQESLTNIHRYSGSQKAVIRLTPVADQIIQVQIADFGRGIPSDILHARSQVVVPLGVGIQGMRERMRQLGGHLHIASEVDSGTVVTATIPLLALQAAEADIAALSSSAALAPENNEPLSATARKRILIADDHEMLRRGLRTMLEKELGWEICGEAVDGQDAVDKATALRPDLLILDINMPVMNGLVAMRQILRRQPKTKILVFTVHDSPQTAKEVKAAGAHGYLSKSKASEDLVRVVKVLLEGKSSWFPGAPVTANASA